MSRIDCRQLLSVLGPEKVIELLEVFLRCGDGWATDLHGEREDWTRAAHNIKGVAGTLGATALAEACLAVERSGPEHLPEHLIEVQSELRAALLDAESYIEQLR
jgi:chemotaxis protein histidine kinase CheA